MIETLFDDFSFDLSISNSTGMTLLLRASVIDYYGIDLNSDARDRSF